jgi:hypothetical protein
MREFLTPDRFANTIKLQRETFTGSFLLVEGSTDRTFYERFTDGVKCRLTVVSGKPSSKIRVMRVLEILDGDNFEGALGIVDADFDRCSLPLPDYSPNLILTDTHDLETLIVQSPALDKVLAEFGSEEKIGKFDREIRDILLECGLSIGYLRWVSQLDLLNLTFEGIEFKKFVNDKTLKLDELALIRTVQNKSQCFTVKCEDIQQKILSRTIEDLDPWQVCCGHDLMEVLSLGLQKAIGSYDTREVRRDVLERDLRLAYEAAYFLDTQIYVSVREWEDANPEYRVWRIDLK